jgi:hypothetical protein
VAKDFPEPVGSCGQRMTADLCRYRAMLPVSRQVEVEGNNVSTMKTPIWVQSRIAHWLSARILAAVFLCAGVAHGQGRTGTSGGGPLNGSAARGQEAVIASLGDSGPMSTEGTGQQANLSTAARNTPPDAPIPQVGKKEQAPPQADPNAYIIGEQDSLMITVWKEKEISGPVVVRPDGKITVPLVGEVKAVGMTPIQLEGVLSEKLKPFVTVPQVTVAVTEIRSRKVYLIGHAAREGTFTINSSTTVLQIITPNERKSTSFASKVHSRHVCSLTTMTLFGEGTWSRMFC